VLAFPPSFFHRVLLGHTVCSIVQVPSPFSSLGKLFLTDSVKRGPRRFLFFMLRWLGNSSGSLFIVRDIPPYAKRPRNPFTPPLQTCCPVPPPILSLGATVSPAGADLSSQNHVGPKKIILRNERLNFLFPAEHFRTPHRARDAPIVETFLLPQRALSRFGSPLPD